jgi:hypothetical protein
MIKGPCLLSMGVASISPIKHGTLSFLGQRIKTHRHGWPSLSLGPFSNLADGLYSMQAKCLPRLSALYAQDSLRLSRL